MITIEEMVEKYGWVDNEANRAIIAELNAKEVAHQAEWSKMVSDIKADIHRRELEALHKKNDKIGLHVS